MSFFANIFGYLLNFLYEAFKNYGIAIIVFSIILKIVLLPISMKQQRTMKKSGKLQKELKEIQEKYKSDPMKMNQETMDLYKRENMSPFSGCLSAIVQIVILLSMFYLVRSPLTHMKKVDSDLINAYSEQIKIETGAQNLAYPEIAVIRDANSQEANIEAGEDVTPVEEEAIQNESENIEEENNVEKEKVAVDVRTPENIEKMHINMEFLGLDLSSIPNQQLNDYRVYIIPVLYVISTFISMRLTAKLTQAKKEDKDGKPNDMDALNQMNKNMSYLMPVLSVSISIMAPLGLALYWLVNNILMIAERVVLNRFLESREEQNVK